MVLNKAARQDANGMYLVAVKVTQGNDKRYFINVPNLRIREETYLSICREYKVARGRIRRHKDIFLSIKSLFDEVCVEINDQISDGTFIMDDFKERWKNRNNRFIKQLSLYKLWREVAESKSSGTEACYLDSLRRFQLDMGLNVGFSDLSKQFIIRWREKMLQSGLSKTTANIYLRALRVVLNESERLNLLAISTKQMFNGLVIGGRNSYNDRKDRYLTTDKWRQLWNLFETNGDGCQPFLSLHKDQQRDKLEALGMMLFMYLANGLNLRDALCLRYDDFYYQHEKKQMMFHRQKVAHRTGCKVVFPVLPQMRIILERIGEKEECGGLVFGYLKGKVQIPPLDRSEERELSRLTALYNSTIGNRMKSISIAVGLPVTPTPTWCRHSFASNLIQAGVPKEYISASMAHSGGNTTDNYIDYYSYEQMVDYNSRLLLDHKDIKRDYLKTLLSDMSKDDIISLLGEL